MHTSIQIHLERVANGFESQMTRTTCDRNRFSTFFDFFFSFQFEGEVCSVPSLDYLDEGEREDAVTPRVVLDFPLLRSNEANLR